MSEHLNSALLLINFLFITGTVIALLFSSFSGAASAAIALCLSLLAFCAKRKLSKAIFSFINLNSAYEVNE